MNIQFNRSTFFGIVAAVLVIGSSACTSKYAFQTSAAVPAARGNVKVKKDGNANYLIKVDVSNLAEVKRLQPAKESYVVWMVGDEDLAKNIGLINSSSSMMSSKLRASFQAVSSTRPRRVFITAEDNGQVTVPGSMVILTTEAF